MKPFRLAFCAALVAATVPALPSSAAVRTFFAPDQRGYPANLCLNDGVTCGKPAADAWCKENGWSEALLFQRNPQPGITRIIDSGDLCYGPSCLAFQQIKCFSPDTAHVDANSNG